MSRKNVHVISVFVHMLMVPHDSNDLSQGFPFLVGRMGHPGFPTDGLFQAPCFRLDGRQESLASAIKHALHQLVGNRCEAIQLMGQMPVLLTHMGGAQPAVPLLGECMDVHLGVLLRPKGPRESWGTPRNPHGFLGPHFRGVMPKDKEVLPLQHEFCTAFLKLGFPAVARSQEQDMPPDEAFLRTALKGLNVPESLADDILHGHKIATPRTLPHTQLERESRCGHQIRRSGISAF